MKPNKPQSIKIITQRRDIRRFKIIGKKKTAGLKLSGTEIKSIRNGQISIDEAYIIPQKSELYLYKASVSTYRYSSLFSKKNPTNQEPLKLLLKKSEINHLAFQIKTKNYNLIPLKV